MDATTSISRAALCKCDHSEMLHKMGTYCYVTGCKCYRFVRHDSDAEAAIGSTSLGDDTLNKGGAGHTGYLYGGGWSEGVYHAEGAPSEPAGSKGGGWSGGHYTPAPIIQCSPTHSKKGPTLVLEGEDWSVSAGARGDVLAHAHNYDFYVNCTGSTASYHHVIPEGMRSALLNGVPDESGESHELLLDWDDMKAPRINPLFWKRLMDYVRTNKLHILVFCVGGHGRTGTALVSMLIALGWHRKHAVKWLRKRYCNKVVETDVQVEYLKRVDRELTSLVPKGETPKSAGETLGGVKV